MLWVCLLCGKYFYFAYHYYLTKITIPNMLHYERACCNPLVAISPLTFGSGLKPY